MENGRHGDLEHLRDHINDAAHELDTRRAEALDAIDRAPFSWFHVKVCLVAGTGFFTDAYDIFAINLASVMLGYVYGHTIVSSGPSPQLSANQDFGIKVAAPIGNLFGQLLFGWLADILGRKRMYGIELMIIITATLVQALAGSGRAVNIIGVIAFWRFVMGVGVGGDYPLSAVITSEFASTRLRGRLMTAVFTAQGWGNFAASLVALIVVAAYKDSIVAGDADRVDYCWRILIGLGCVPDRDVRRAATDIDNVLGPRGNSAGVYWVDPDADAVVQRADAPRRSRSDFMTHFGQWHNLQRLIGVAYSWFAVAFYGLGLNSSAILTSDTLHNVAEGSLVVSLAGLLPGYYATFFLIDVWGRKPIQFMGFLRADSAIGRHCKTKALYALYCLAKFFTNFGPNVTTFIIPGEIFPTRYSSTAHGLAAAFSEYFEGCFSMTGIASTLLLDVETMDRSLEELSQEQRGLSVVELTA
ncbi:phosphate transporter [Lactarius pseudohatsudake]|nr:phosphate transporter [Lactarius pseudohatsudake]